MATHIQRLQARKRRSSRITLRKASCLCVQCTQILFAGSSGLTHWKIRSVIREVECASVCNNSSPKDRSCLKFRLEDTKVHPVILHGSKICVSNQKRVLNVIILLYAAEVKMLAVIHNAKLLSNTDSGQYIKISIISLLPWEDEAFLFHGPVHWGEAGGHRSKPKVVLALHTAKHTANPEPHYVPSHQKTSSKIWPAMKS